MGALRVAFIGTGKKPEKASAMGYGMAQMHAMAYQALKGEVEIVACADIVRENALAFAEMYGVPAKSAYTDYREMLAKEPKFDIVSICTWPHLHAPMTIACAEAKAGAVYCEKPMAYSFGDAKKMHQTCVMNGTKLHFNHQRRFGKPYRMARKLIDDGVIGKLERVEFTCGDIYDYGTHSVDLSNYLNGEQSAKWVIAQIDYREEKLIFGAHCENQALVQWEYQNGVLGLGSTGAGAKHVAAHNKAIGSNGVIELGSHDPAAKEKPVLRYRTWGMKDWEYVDTQGEHLHGPGYIDRAIADLVACLKRGESSELGSAQALRATEIIFAAYHSSRIHGRVDLPLVIEGHPLVAMVEEGLLKPHKKPAS
ncbi:MAG: Gfo/Idh/MocA family oxidoreductase [Planctomycetota bacterium]|nr:Gfo/Idh/MocA family oxidoreductase [Planctomycetota bacterium]